MKTFEDYLEVILQHEGGLSNHSSDPGGITKYGISLRFLKSNKIDINKDGKIDANDIINLTIDEASIIYKEYFWNKMKLDYIDNELLKLHLFDMGVNAGTKTAIKLLQRIVGASQDGVLGNMTASKVTSYIRDIVEDYSTARKDYYSYIISKNPKLSVFRKGWFRRVNTTKFI